MRQEGPVKEVMTPRTSISGKGLIWVFHHEHPGSTSKHVKRQPVHIGKGRSLQDIIKSRKDV